VGEGYVNIDDWKDCNPDYSIMIWGGSEENSRGGAGGLVADIKTFSGGGIVMGWSALRGGTFWGALGHSAANKPTMAENYQRAYIGPPKGPYEVPIGTRLAP
jgi:hypothetical protein